MVIIDPESGRPLIRQAWSAGLLQAVEAKEGLMPSEAQEVRTRLSLPGFLRRVPRLVVMGDGLARLEGELWQLYELPLLRIGAGEPPRGEELRRLVEREVMDAGANGQGIMLRLLRRLHGLPGGAGVSRLILRGLRWRREMQARQVRLTALRRDEQQSELLAFAEPTRA